MWATGHELAAIQLVFPPAALRRSHPRNSAHERPAQPSRARSRAWSRVCSAGRSARTSSRWSSPASSRRRWTSTAPSPSHACTSRTSTRCTSPRATGEQFLSYEGSLLGELQEYLAEHARREGYSLLSSPRVLDHDRRRPRDRRVRHRHPGRPAAGPTGGSDRAAGTAGAFAREPARGRPAGGCGGTDRRPSEYPLRRSSTGRPHRSSPTRSPRKSRRLRARETVTLTIGDRVYPVTVGRVVLGRSRECDIRVADANVSRRHCEIVQDGPTTLERRRPRLDQRHGAQRAPGCSARR